MKGLVFSGLEKADCREGVIAANLIGIERLGPYLSQMRKIFFASFYLSQMKDIFFASFILAKSKRNFCKFLS